MGIIIDLIILGVFVLFIFLGVKKGFVRTLLEMVGFFLALALAVMLSAGISGLIYQTMIRPSVVNAINDGIGNTADNSISSVMESLPGYVKNLADQTQVEKTVQRAVDSKGEHTAENIADTLVKPVAENVLRAVLCILLFIVGLVLFRYLTKLIGKLVKITPLGGLDGILGGVLGGIKGLVFVCIAAMVFVLATPFLGPDFPLINTKTKEESMIIRMLENSNPVASILEI